jgi:hypothetical protein
VPRGAGCVGIDWADVDSKYRALMLAPGLAADKIDKSLNVIRHFRDAPGGAALTELLQ